MKKFALISLGLATSSLALGYSLSGRWVWAFLITITGLFWLAGQWYAGARSAPVGLTLFVGAAAWGVWSGVAAGWMLGGTVAALVAWDLAHFSQHLEPGEYVEKAAELQRTHLRRLFTVAGLGLLLGGVGLNIQLDITFGWALVLGLLAMVGLSWLIVLARGERG